MRNPMIHRQFLKDANGEWNGKSMTTATGTYYSDPIRVNKSRGYAALLVLTSAGSLAITMEVSLNGVDYYTPKDTDGNDLGTLATALAANTWIVFTPQIAEYMRFKFVLTSADSTVSVTYIQQE